MLTLETKAGIADHEPDIERRRGIEDLPGGGCVRKIDLADLCPNRARIFQACRQLFESFHAACNQHEIHAHGRKPLGK